MFELTPEKCKELEKIVVEKICPPSQEKEMDSYSNLYKLMVQIASRSAVEAIWEYEKMKAADEGHQ